MSVVKAKRFISTFLKKEGMTNEILLYIGSIVIIVWGIAHIIPTKSVVNGFGSISQDSRRIITMEWIAAGLTLIFIGFMVLVLTYVEGSNTVSLLVYQLSAVMLIILAVLSLFTGARTSILPNKMCPIIMTIVAILFLLGSIL